MTITFRNGSPGSTYVLEDGEPGWDSVNKIFKVGDGVTTWAGLPAWGGAAPGVASPPHGTFLGTWQWNPAGNLAPGFAQITGNGPNAQDITMLSFSTVTRGNQNIVGMANWVAKGTRIHAFSQSNLDSWVSFEVTGPPTQNTTALVTVPVHLLARGPASTAGWTDINVLIAVG